MLFLGHATNFSTGLTMVDTSASATYYGESAGDRAGTAVTGLGDIDGDGAAEVMALEFPGDGHAIPSIEGNAHAVQTAVAWLVERLKAK